jgi:small subunit ribosomal protein S8e
MLLLGIDSLHLTSPFYIASFSNCQNKRNNALAWHDRLTKRKKTGGKKRAYRTKRVYEQGRQPVETLFGETKRKTVKGVSNVKKIKLVKAEYVNVSNPDTGRTERLEILDVVSNPANADYNRRGVITRGTIVRTEKGLARIISRPGQQGALNAVVYEE